MYWGYRMGVLKYIPMVPPYADREAQPSVLFCPADKYPNSNSWNAYFGFYNGIGVYGLNIDTTIDYGGKCYLEARKARPARQSFELHQPSGFGPPTTPIPTWAPTASTLPMSVGPQMAAPMRVTRTGRWCNVLWADGHVTSVMNPGWRGGPGYLSNYLYYDYANATAGPLGPGWTSSGCPWTRAGTKYNP